MDVGSARAHPTILSHSCGVQLLQGAQTPGSSSVHPTVQSPTESELDVQLSSATTGKHRPTETCGVLSLSLSHTLLQGNLLAKGPRCRIQIDQAPPPSHKAGGSRGRLPWAASFKTAIQGLCTSAQLPAPAPPKCPDMRHGTKSPQTLPGNRQPALRRVELVGVGWRWGRGRWLAWRLSRPMPLLPRKTSGPFPGSTCKSQGLPATLKHQRGPAGGAPANAVQGAMGNGGAGERGENSGDFFCVDIDSLHKPSVKLGGGLGLGSLTAFMTDMMKQKPVSAARPDPAPVGSAPESQASPSFDSWVPGGHW